MWMCAIPEGGLSHIMAPCLDWKITDDVIYDTRQYRRILLTHTAVTTFTQNRRTSSPTWTRQCQKQLQR